MGMKSMYELREMLCNELDEITRKGELGAGDLDIAHKLTDTIKNIDKIEMLSGGYARNSDSSPRRYSREGYWPDDTRHSYDGEEGHSRRGIHYVRGHYSRDGRKEDMKRQLQEMLDGADDDSIRKAIQRCMDTMDS